MKRPEFKNSFIYRYPPSELMPALKPEELYRDLKENKVEKLGIYIHIPFCKNNCIYCHYFRVINPEREQIEKYVAAVKGEIEFYAELFGGKEIESVFFGGGTPTLIETNELIGLVEKCIEKFNIKTSAEITVEASPETLEGNKLNDLKLSGFNRISLGVQSFNDEINQFSSRKHTKKQALDSFNLARNSGFDNINIDLLYGLPKQTMGSWENSVEEVKKLDPESVTVAELQLMDSAAVSKIDRNLLPLRKQREEMYYYALELLVDMGFKQIFPYQFVKEGKEFKFLENYWSGGEFIGMGASSLSFVEGWDYNNAFPLEFYLNLMKEHAFSASTGKKLSKKEAAIREITLGIKLAGGNRREKGCEIASIEKKYGVDFNKEFGEVLGRMKAEGLMEEEKGRVFLSKKGLSQYDEIAAEFFSKEVRGNLS